VTALRVWVDGAASDCVPVCDRGLAYGDGVFETMRCRRGLIPLLERHLDRVCSGARRLGIVLDAEALRDEVERFATQASAIDCVIKLIVTRGDGTGGYRSEPATPARRILLERPLAAYPSTWWSEGITVRHCEMRLGSNPVLAGIKHLNRLEQVFARREWDDPQVAEGLMADQRGRIVEGISSNLFLVSGARLLTPFIETCGVAGVMRAHLLETVAPALGIVTAEVHCERALLAGAQEVFVCNAVIGVWPVHCLGRKRWSPGPVTRRVQDHVARLFTT